MRFFLLVVVVLVLYKSSDAQKVESKNLLDRVGDTVTISGKIYSGAFLINVKTKPTFLNLGDTNPNHRLMIRIEPEDRDKFPSPPEAYYLNKEISVTGVVNNYKGIPLIKVSQPEMIKSESNVVITPSTAPVATTGQPTTPVAQPAEKKADVEKKLPDTLLQTKWVNKVASKNIEQINKNLSVVKKEIPLRISPNDKAPVIALLNPGIVVSVLDKLRKWSHIVVRTVDGSNSVFGFIKNRSLRHLKKLL
jgi:hypothetical protein